MTSPWLLLGSGWIALCLFMTVVWLVSRVIHNAGIVDVAWALGFTLAAALYIYLGHPSNIRQGLMLMMNTIWSLRLAWHLALRFKKWYPEEDPRYTALRAQMGDSAEVKMLMVFLWQASILALMTAPLAVAVADRRSDLDVWQYAGMAMWLVALCGESLADYQLSLFTAQPLNKGRTCQIGLWRYSRHPNYFFEWLGSLAFFIYASDSPYGIWTVICPAVLLHLLINVSGVKPAEAHSLQSRSDYADYKRRTSTFVPWFRKDLS